MDVRVFPLGPLQTNCFMLSHQDRAVVVDPGGDPASVVDMLKAENLSLTHILVTHFHFDHIYGNAALAKATGAPILASPDGAPVLATETGAGGFMGFPRVEDFDYDPIEPGKTEFLGLECQILATPGHAPGSLSFYFPQAKAVFSGDLIFERSIGRTDFYGGDMNLLLTSVRKEIFTLPPETVIYPGHGDATTVGEEMRHNPYFTDFIR